MASPILNGSSALVQRDQLRFLSGEEIVPVRGALLSLEAARGRAAGA